jgi:Fe-S-cluster containining protein
MISEEKEKNIILELREKIPKQIVGCWKDENGFPCGYCCSGSCIFSKWEWNNLKDQRYDLGENGYCPYYNKNEHICDVYEDRGIICRIYGIFQTWKYYCFQHANIKFLDNIKYNETSERKIVQKMYNLYNENGCFSPNYKTNKFEYVKNRIELDKMTKQNSQFPPIPVKKLWLISHNQPKKIEKII